MTPDQLQHAKAERDGIPADAEQSVEIRDTEMRRLVAELMARREGLLRAVEQARLARGPVDLTPGIVGMLGAIAVALGIVLDGELRERGLEPALQFRVPVERSNGNGEGAEKADGPRLVVPA